MADQLSGGALATIMQGGDFTEPIVQVLSVKKMNAGGQPEKDRYRAYLSDGQYTVSFAMMTAPVYAKAGDKGLSKFSILKIVRFITSVINNTEGKDSRVLLILDLEVLQDGDSVGEKIGNPVPYTDASGATAAGRPGGGDKPTTSNKAPLSNGGGHESGPAPKMPRLSNSASAGTSNGNLTLAGHITHPISSLSPYHNKWIIKARVTNKSDIRKWENARGSGQLFSFEVIDESGEIRVTAFKDQVDKFYDMIQVDKVYYISKCQLKTANKQFNALKNDYEMTMGSETVVEECHDDDMSSLQTQFDFVDISKIADLEANAIVDIIGVAKSVGEIQTFQARTTGRELKKKEVQLVDQSNTSVTLTLWGTQAENFDGNGNPVVVLKGAKVGEFGGGKSISTISGTMMKINPEIKECFRLKGWFESEGMNSTATDLSVRTGGGGSFNTPWMCFKETTDKQLGSIDTAKGDYYQVKGTILLLRTENCIYKACASPDCNKKVIDNNDGTYRCEKCNKSFESFKYRLLCSMNVGDWSGNQWVSMFSDEAEKVVGMTAQAAGELYDSDPSDRSKFNEAMEKAHFKEYILKCRAKMETYNDEQRLKTVAIRADPLNYEEYNNHLISSIKELANL